MCEDLLDDPISEEVHRAAWILLLPEVVQADDTLFSGFLHQASCIVPILARKAQADNPERRAQNRKI